MPDWTSRFKRQDEPPIDDEDTQSNRPLGMRLARLEQELIGSMAALTDKVGEYEKHLARLAKEQFKANTLAENVHGEVKAALARITQETSSDGDRPSQLKPPVPNLRLLEAIMPILDSIEAGLASGQAQISTIGDEHAREILAGWLDGQRLLRERLLALLEKENVRPIDTIGQVFDPYQHVAVETVYDPFRDAGTIVEERRRGYEMDQRVLRFAEVVVTSNRQS